MKTQTRAYNKAFTLMELLVVIAIFVILAALLFPVIRTLQARANCTAAATKMRQLAGGAIDWAGEHDGALPDEGPSNLSWKTTAAPENSKIWVNAIPNQQGMKGAGDYLTHPQDFYSKECFFWLPGARYPTGGRELARPFFPMAMNTKLQRRDSDGKKAPLTLSTITNPDRTILFFSCGLPDESKDDQAHHPTKKKFTGDAKGGPGDFVGRYQGYGILIFVDGHSEPAALKDILTLTGDAEFPNPQIIWCRTPDEDPNTKP